MSPIVLTAKSLQSISVMDCFHSKGLAMQHSRKTTSGSRPRIRVAFMLRCTSSELLVEIELTSQWELPVVQTTIT